MADWSKLPKDLLEEIARRLESAFYLLRFRSVCSSWRSSVTSRPRRLPGRFPFLTNHGICATSLGFHLSQRSIFLMGLPNSRNQRDPDRWLVKIEEDVPGRMHLLNPLSRFQLKPLPEAFPKVLDLSKFSVFELGGEFVLHYVHFRPFGNGNSLVDDGNLYMEKVVFMCSGSESNDFVLLTIHVSGKLAMFKSEDKRWTIIHDMPSPYDDVIMFKGQFYAVDGTGRTVTVGLNSNLSLVANPVFGGDKKFLVESSGELLVVDMYLSITAPKDLDDLDVDDEVLQMQFSGCLTERTVRFEVFKLDREGKKLVEMKSLGDRVLFLGDDCTFSASASQLSGCKGNCILFTDNFFYMGSEEECVFKARDIGVFDLDDGGIAPLSDYPEYSKLFWPPPDWVASTTSEVQTQLEELAI
ncbi:F-box protein SKIP23 [Pyrus x bretschneideri]|uniref:F-box protein SKIP23 n=1 Tax=Pyrus x bretschneideri TaxID=225117 RepID=UPI00202F4A23|nr:F-box protein SKIP23 [Pyrus x bretschneideri]